MELEKADSLVSRTCRGGGVRGRGSETGTESARATAV